jgi:hypothetical protein
MAFPATFADMQQSVFDKARLDEGYDVSRVSDWLNNAYMTALVESGFYQAISRQVGPLTSGQTSSFIPPEVQKIEYVVPIGTDGAVWAPMLAVGFEELLRNRAWQGGATPWTGAPSRYSYRSGPSVLGSMGSIEFWPVASGGETLTFYGWGLPAPMSQPGDQPIIPEPWRQVIIYGALIHASEFQKDLLMIQQFTGDYQDWMARFVGWKNHLGTSQSDQFQVEFQRPWPKGNSVDLGW